jgi:hypothetical protein
MDYFTTTSIVGNHLFYALIMFWLHIHVKCVTLVFGQNRSKILLSEYI